jgi:DNA-directed RNA polymerase subunit RPC12/RpoP
LPVAAADAPAAIKCGRCGREMSLSITDGVRADRAVDRCPVCSGADFYVRKDFNPRLGLTVVIIGALVSAVFYWFGRDLIAYSILASAALIDLVVYGRLKDVTVCYRCHTEFRGAYERRAGAFDLHTADVLEMEYERRVGKR